MKDVEHARMLMAAAEKDLQATVSFKEFKRKISYWMARAARGVPVQITRYNRPYIFLI